jgi:hypothetical protein
MMAVKAPIFPQTTESLQKAKADEKDAIVKVLAGAETVAPGTRIRFVQRETDEMGRLLVISLNTPADSQSNSFNLYAIAHELGDPNSDLNVTITQNATPEEGKQLLKITSFVPKDKIAIDFKEPRSPSILERIYRWFTDPALLAYVILVAVTAYNCGLQQGHDSMPKFLHSSSENHAKINNVRATIDDAIRDIEEQSSKRDVLHIGGRKLKQLEAEKDALGKARLNLMHADYPELRNDGP